MKFFTFSSLASSGRMNITVLLSMRTGILPVIACFPLSVIILIFLIVLCFVSVSPE